MTMPLPPRAALLAFVLASLSSQALADGGKAACIDAVSKGQKLRTAHQLLEARDQFRACAAAQCPTVIQSDCANWLADVERTLPEVVIAAKDGAGEDLVKVRVTLDGQLLTKQLDGHAIPLNAGPHAFHFEGPDGTTLDRQVLVREGEKNQSVAVVLGPVAVRAPAPPPPASSGAPFWRTIGWAVGGVGIAGLVVGGVAGAVAVSDKSSAHCSGSNVCDPGTVSGIKAAALASDVGWAVGGVLTAAGLGIVLFAPSKSSEKATTARIVPVISATGGQLVLGGRW